MMNDIIVVGGGLVGKSTALALCQAGFEVSLLATKAMPKPADWAFDARVYAFSSSSQALLERLKIWPNLDQTRLSAVLEMQVFGDRQGELHFSAFESHVARLAWIVESSLVEQALDAALRYQSRLHWIEARANGFEVQNDHVAVRLENGQTLTASLVVGADGVHSWVRSQMDNRVERKEYPQMGVVANFKAQKSHQETAYQWFENGDIVALLPLPDNHVSLVWSTSVANAQALLALDGELLAKRVEQVTHGQLGELVSVSPAHAFPLVLQTVEHLVTPRVVLVGDAAHVMHPLAGQGMNLGLRDVHVLVDMLSRKEGFRDLGEVRLLRRYERARRFDIQSLLWTTDCLYQLFSVEHSLFCLVRNHGLSFLSKQRQLKKMLVNAALG